VNAYLATCTLAAATLAAACSGEHAYPPLPDGKQPPYVLHDNCSFTIISENGSARIDSPEFSGPGASGSASIMHGDLEIEVADCRVIRNPAGLGIYRPPS